MWSNSRDDEELIAAIQRKDVDALEAFYNRHRVLAYSLALQLLGNDADAEDVVQESLPQHLALLRNLPSGEGDGPLVAAQRGPQSRYWQAPRPGPAREWEDEGKRF